VTQAPHDAAPRYRLDARIATGGMGEVWRATDTVLDREVAVKVLKHEYADDPAFRTRFRAEARHAASLHHPGVAAVFDFGELPDETTADGTGVPRPYLVMELVPGQPLSSLLRSGTPMAPDTAADLVAQAADAVAAAHALGIVHRDLKPANLLVTPDGRVKITDFGIARAVSGAAVTQTGQVLGTPAYLSPEQAEGLPATEASDIYSLGVVLHECLAGRRPFDSDSPVATALAHLRDQPPPLPDDVPDHLRQAAAVALAKDPARRFGSMAAFATALRGTGTAVLDAPAAAAADDDPTPTRVMGVPPAAPAGPVPAREREVPRRRSPAWLPWALAAAAVLAVVLLVSLLVRPDEDPARSGSDGGPGAGGGSPSATPSATRAPAAATVEVDADDYRGLDKRTVRQQLEALGLRVTEQQSENDGSVAEGTVLDLVPVGTLAEGAEVTIVTAGPAPGGEPPGHGKGEGKGKDKAKGPEKDKD
jgi:tRNA A-37 threonylcarbamoyl transferase component Bud32